MIRTLAILVLLGTIVGLAVTEQVIVDNVYGKMVEETAAIIAMVESTPDTHNPDDFKFGDDIKSRIDKLHRYWIRRERHLSIIIRHIDLTYVSDSLIYARNFIHFDNKEESMSGLSRLEYFLDTYKNVFGFNGANIL